MLTMNTVTANGIAAALRLALGSKPLDNLADVFGVERGSAFTECPFYLTPRAKDLILPMTVGVDHKTRLNTAIYVANTLSAAVAVAEGIGHPAPKGWPSPIAVGKTHDAMHQAWVLPSAEPGKGSIALVIVQEDWEDLFKYFLAAVVKYERPNG